MSENLITSARRSVALSRTDMDAGMWEKTLVAQLEMVTDALEAATVDSPHVDAKHWAQLTAARAEIARLTEASRPRTVTTAEELEALPVGSVVMSVIDIPGRFEQRVWQRFGGLPDWQFGIPRHDWQSTDGGFVRVGDEWIMRPQLTVLHTPEASA